MLIGANALLFANPGAQAAPGCLKTRLERNTSDRTLLSLGHNHEYVWEHVYEHVEQARDFVFRFPLLKKLGVPFDDYSKWERFAVTMNSSDFYGLKVGWQRVVPGGGKARIRLDYDPNIGLHYNIELMKVNVDGTPSNYLYAIRALCNGEVCSRKQAKKIAEKLAK